MRVGPQRLGARRRPGRVGGRHLPGEQERPRGHGAGGDLRRKRLDLARASRHSARSRGRAAGADAHGTGPASAQSTLTVAGSSWKRRIAAAVRARQVVATAPGRRRGAGAATSASTARRAATAPRRRCARRAARPSRTSDPVDLGAADGSRPPRACSRPARAWVSAPAPPRAPGSRPSGRASSSAAR